jgi:hypothetical protein
LEREPFEVRLFIPFLLIVIDFGGLIRCGCSAWLVFFLKEEVFWEGVRGRGVIRWGYGVMVALFVSRDVGVGVDGMDVCMRLA